MSNSQNSQMNKGFLSHLMAHLLEGSQIPKVQVVSWSSFFGHKDKDMLFL